MQKANSNSSAETNADSEQKAEAPTSSQHDIKPNVVGSLGLSSKETSDLLNSSMSENYLLGVVGYKEIVKAKRASYADKYLAIKSALKGMSLKDANWLLHDCRELIEQEALVS